MTLRKQDTCSCDAYQFPHRSGGGKCWAPFYICTSCLAACEATPSECCTAETAEAASRTISSTKLNKSEKKVLTTHTHCV